MEATCAVVAGRQAEVKENPSQNTTGSAVAAGRKKTPPVMQASCKAAATDKVASKEANFEAKDDTNEQSVSPTAMKSSDTPPSAASRSIILSTAETATANTSQPNAPAYLEATEEATDKVSSESPKLNASEANEEISGTVNICNNRGSIASASSVFTQDMDAHTDHATIVTMSPEDVTTMVAAAEVSRKWNSVATIVIGIAFITFIFAMLALGVIAAAFVAHSQRHDSNECSFFREYFSPAYPISANGFSFLDYLYENSPIKIDIGE